MKTAMQELIEWVEVRFSNSHQTEVFKKATELLEKEKEQIVDAFIQGGEQWNSEDESVIYYEKIYNKNK